MECWQKRFVRLKFPYSAKRLRIEDAFLLKDKHIPAKLYKYRAFTENHLAALEEGVLWMSAPERFNDPYDTAVYFETNRFLADDISAEDFVAENQRRQEHVEAGNTWEPRHIKNPVPQKQWMEKVQHELLKDEPQAVRDAMMAAICDHQEKVNRELVEKFTAHMRNGFGVLSLAESPLSSLMWSHYSDSHRGFCIEYDFSALPYSDLRRRLCFPVFYRRKLTDATRYLAWRDRDHFNNLFGQLLCLLKSDEWAYEKEWRIVHMIGPSHANMKLGMPRPSAVVLGCQASPEDAARMGDICKRIGIRLQRVKQRHDAFRFELTDINSS
jgi:hypothetical protein